jgi:hypothetical protein
MCIVSGLAENSWKYSRKIRLLTGAAGIASAIFLCKPALADYSIQLPAIGTTTYNVTVANTNIDGGAVADADNASFNNTTVLNDFLSYAAAHGGGTVLVPAASDYYATTELSIGNNTNLEVATGATIENLKPDNTFMTTINASQDSNIEISGGGIINDNATNTSSNHMLILENINDFEVNGVTIENSSEEHLVCENDNNVLINAVTINDSKIQANTDGIDYSGNNYLIENCSITDGDDDIVAKPLSTACSNIYIQNITIGNGHGISIGGQTNLGLNGMFVNNVTINMASQSNANGIDLKAGAGFGGLVQNVTFNNVSINNVDDALIISSYYGSNGNESYPSNPAPVYTPAANEPFWDDITMENININDVSSNALDAYGLNVTGGNNVDGLNFLNVTATNDTDPWKMFYCNDVYINGVTINGVTIADAQGNYKPTSSGNEVSEEGEDTFDLSPNPIYQVDVPTLIPGLIPEPSTLAIGGVAALILLARRRREQTNSTTT